MLQILRGKNITFFHTSSLFRDGELSPRIEKLKAAQWYERLVFVLYQRSTISNMSCAL